MVGVAMDSPLWPIFANYYMRYLEEGMFSDTSRKPLIYTRYVDNIFIMYKFPQQFYEIKIKKKLDHINSKIILS